MAADKLKKHNKLILGVIVQFLISFVIAPFIPTWGTVTELGVRIICLFFGALIGLIIGENMMFPSFISMIALVWHGYYADGNAVGAAVLGHPVVFQLVYMCAMAHAINMSGAGEVIANKILRIGFIQKRPVALSVALIFAFVVASNFMGGFVVLLIAYPILNNVLKQANLKHDGNYANFMRVGLFLSAVLGEQVKGTINAMFLSRIQMFNEALTAAGLPIVNNGQYTLFAVICVLVYFIVVPIYACIICRKELSGLKAVDFRELEGMEPKPFTAEQIVLLISFFVYAFYGLICRVFPALSVIGQAAWGAVLCVILMCIRIKGKPIFDGYTCFKDGVDWSTCFVLGAFVVIGSALTSEQAGIQSWLTAITNPLFSGKSAMVLVILIIVFTTVLTNFFSNIACATIAAAICCVVMIPYVSSGQLNPAALCLACNISSQCAFLTWAATGTAPLLHREKGLSSKFVWTWGASYCLLFMVVVGAVLCVCSMIPAA